MTSGQIENAAALTVVTEFIEQCTRPVEGVWIRNDAFYLAYCKWARANQRLVVSSIAFGKVLTIKFSVLLVRKRIYGKQYSGRVGLWPRKQLREFLKKGVDYM